jgi:hypothetical protein
VNKLYSETLLEKTERLTRVGIEETETALRSLHIEMKQFRRKNGKLTINEKRDFIAAFKSFSRKADDVKFYGTTFLGEI